MALSAAFPGTVVRLPRTAAVRRALHLVLLVGGLFLLAVLGGERAHAAEGAPPVSVASAASVVPVTSGAPVTAPRPVTGHPGSGHAAASGRSVVGGVLAPVRPVTGRVVQSVRPAAERVLAPVRTLRDTASRVLDATGVKVRPPSPLPGPALPGLPRGPEPSPPPVRPLPAPVVPGPARGHQAPATHAQHPAPAPAGGLGTERRDAAHAGDGTAAAGSAPVPAPASYGPFRARASHRPLVAEALAHPLVRRAHRTGASAGLPGCPGSGGDPAGVPGKQAADGGSSRHGDAQALSPAARASVRLVSAGAARADATRTRERHRDIPVFPG
ncbi:hypothetical protein [Streptomyces sp. NPDC005573]|uniref:hypothetical protein n=1 Tax=Streptomyces sp. NPDC005573 TaxID=3156890 RepID=UPI0033AF492F